MKTRCLAILYAILAAIFYALSTPISKLLLDNVTATFMASFLYLGAGIGVGIMYIFHFKKEDKTEQLTKNDLSYTIGMVLLDIMAPIFMMLGIKLGTASSASLLGNFEIVATAIIALCIFKESITNRLWIAIGFITIASAVLSIENVSAFNLSYGSLFVILATVCWGVENNCTRAISNKSTYQIVTIKGICSGLGSFIIALIIGERIPSIIYILLTMLLGFVAYGLSIFTYIRAQRTLGAAKTSAYYALAPFIGSFLAFILVGEQLNINYIISVILMIIGTVFVIWDTMVKRHKHLHTHIITHTHDGITHTHTFEHTHPHDHMIDESKHGHTHSKEEIEKMLLNEHQK